MLARRLRVKPWRERVKRSSSGRVTFKTLVASSTSTLMSRCGTKSSLPLGPSTKTLPSAKRTFTPAGRTTGCLPIRDMARLLPHGAKQFAAQALGPGAAVAHDALAGAQDGDA